MNIIEINKRIYEEFCENTFNQLTDQFLINDYKKCKSVINHIKELDNVLIKYVKTDVKEKIINEYLQKLIPAGTKGVIRGNKFNYIVKNYIIELQLNSDRFEVNFEKKCELFKTTEIPDWYILDKNQNKILIGMNQLDLWNGGQQLNRGYKYLIENSHNTYNSKLICVVCNFIQLKSNKNKVYKLFEIGFTNNTLCYLKNLNNIILSYFN